VGTHHAPGKAVSFVGQGLDVDWVKWDVQSCKQGRSMGEGFVMCRISRMTFPEGGNYGRVVTMNFKAGVMKATLGQPQGSQFEANGFCLANVSALRCPARSEMLSGPMTSHEEAYPPGS